MTDTALSLSPLIRYALQGLRRCWMPERGRYSHRYRLDGTLPANKSVPESDAFYTLNVLLGFSQLADDIRHGEIETAATYYASCEEAKKPRFAPYACGMAAWAGARLGLNPPGHVIDRINSFVASAGELSRLTAQDLGMLAAGATALAAADAARWRPVADLLAAHLRDHRRHPGSHLFGHRETGLRRSFSSFASQVYGTLALYLYGEAFGIEWAVRLANESVASIIALQGPRGEWGWFYEAASGRVVDFYEIYSVHQHGMAPAILHHAAQHGVVGARDALVKGFLWLFGNNEMGVSMLCPKEHLFYRSQFRRGEARAPWRRACRGIFNSLLRRSDEVARHRGLALRRECRSYELGWLLWSFGTVAAEYPELAARPEFAV